MKKLKINSAIIIATCLTMVGCSSKDVVTKELEKGDVRTIVEQNNDVRSKVVPPKALRATIYPYTTENGSFIDKHEMFYWVSLPKFSGRKTIKEKPLDNKIQEFIKE